MALHRAMACLGALTLAVLLSGFDGRGMRGETQRMQRERIDAASPLLEGETTRHALDDATLCGIARLRRCDIAQALARGLIETGLEPRFPEGLDCRGIDEGYAISYTTKRVREQYHGGIDMPAPWGEPIIASADGTVVAVYGDDNSMRGNEVLLRHSPQDTGLALWIYTEYAHFSEKPAQRPGQRVRMGEVLGLTGNSGLNRYGNQQSGRRRPAIHYAAFYSDSPQFVEVDGRVIVPVRGWWMDPLALFRNKLPLDSVAMKALPENDKRVPVAVMLEDGSTVPAGVKIVWPYRCRAK
jgi:murein DD-endopeptidase MepM/ murein hydrolase activator NlpD